MKKLLYLVLLAVAAILFYSILGSDSGDQTYALEVAEVRKERVNFLKSSEQSPFKLTGQKMYPISYYPIEKSYRVNARLERIQTIERINITNSDGTSDTYQKYAYALFELKNLPCELLILKPVGFGIPNTFFTAFADETSGNQTYGGGRYLDLEIGKSDRITIDFNLAYNPYCAYVGDYSCPLPPPENVLSVAVEAGEKDYPH